VNLLQVSDRSVVNLDHVTNAYFMPCTDEDKTIGPMPASLVLWLTSPSTDADSKIVLRGQTAELAWREITSRAITPHHS
jgi:hypothetical protein